MGDDEVWEVEVLRPDGRSTWTAVRRVAGLDTWGLAFDSDGIAARGHGGDAYAALQDLRRSIEPVLVRCFGTSLDVFPSGMARDMGAGLSAYRHGPDGDLELRGIFEPDDDWVACTVDEQREFAHLALRREVPGWMWRTLRWDYGTNPMVIYKCNDVGGPRYMGEWHDFLDKAAAEGGSAWWGGSFVTSQGKARKVAIELEVGQRFLLWQIWDDRPKDPRSGGAARGAVGVAEMVDWRNHDDGEVKGYEWRLAPVEVFDPPVDLIAHRKLNPLIDGLFTNNRQLGTFVQLTAEEEQEVIRLCRANTSAGRGWRRVRKGAKGAGQGYERAEKNAIVERAAVDRVTASLEADGWSVTSVETEKVGYDLVARRGRLVRHIEVKGVSGSLPSFFLTANEADVATTDPTWEIWVVTGATTTPTDHCFTGAELELRYDLTAVVYRATPTP